jgi:hypothetical protein
MDPAGRRAEVKTNFRHFDAIRTTSYGVNAPFMQLERHGWDIHAI